MIQEYTWKLTLPEGWDVDRVLDAIYQPIKDLIRFNRYVPTGTIELEEDHVLVVLALQGHDRWWIRKRVPYLIASVVARAGIPTEFVEHVEIRTPPNLKKARFRNEQGKRIWVPSDGSDPGPQLTIKKCVKCKDPRHWYWTEGWKTGPKAAHPGVGH